MSGRYRCPQCGPTEETWEEHAVSAHTLDGEWADKDRDAPEWRHASAPLNHDDAWWVRLEDYDAAVAEIARLKAPQGTLADDDRGNLVERIVGALVANDDERDHSSPFAPTLPEMGHYRVMAHGVVDFLEQYEGEMLHRLADLVRRVAAASPRLQPLHVRMIAGELTNFKHGMTPDPGLLDQMIAHLHTLADGMERAHSPDGEHQTLGQRSMAWRIRKGYFTETAKVGFKMLEEAGELARAIIGEWEARPGRGDPEQEAAQVVLVLAALMEAHRPGYDLLTAIEVELERNDA